MSEPLVPRLYYCQGVIVVYISKPVVIYYSCLYVLTTCPSLIDVCLKYWMSSTCRFDQPNPWDGVRTQTFL